MFLIISSFQSEKKCGKNLTGDINTISESEQKKGGGPVSWQKHNLTNQKEQ